MDWNKFRSGWLGTAIGAISASWVVFKWIEFTIGLAGVPDDLRTIFKMMSLVPSWVGAVALTLFGVFLIEKWGDNVVFAAKSLWRKGLGTSFIWGLMLGVIVFPLAGIATLLIYLHLQAGNLVHPTMTTAEQTQVKAACKTEATRFSANIVRRAERVAARQGYYLNCLIAEGFVSPDTEASEG